MVGLDKLLSVIENPARRRILEALVMEPHYPLQLSKELGMSQQAVMKHLKVLEGYDLVHSFEEESDLGGPMRKRYYPALNFTIILDIGPNLFNTEIFSRTIAVELPERAKEVSDADKFEAKALALRTRIADIDGKLDELQRNRELLIQEKEKAIDGSTDRLMVPMGDYQLRRGPSTSS